MEESETYNLILKEPNERTTTILVPKQHTLGAFEDRIEEIARDTENWPRFQRDQFLILVRGIIINEQYTRNVKLQDIQGPDSHIQILAILYGPHTNKLFYHEPFDVNPNRHRKWLSSSAGCRSTKSRTKSRR